MHKIQEKEFTLEDFSCDHLLCGSVLDDVPNNDGKWVQFNGSDCLKDTIYMLNKARELYLQTKDKRFWWQMIQLLPSSYNQTRNVMLNYEALANIYKSRKDHKLDEWREFCKWIEILPYNELIVGGPDFKKIFNIPEETIDKFNAIGNINAMDSKNIREAIDEYEKEKED